MSIPNNDMFQSFKNTLLSNAHAVAEQFTPVLTTSKFKDTGVLTPEEFVSAGDLLVAKCPTWSWSAGDADKRRNHLPPQKQFLITKGVPCKQRVRGLEGNLAKAEEFEVDGGWVATNVSENGNLESASHYADMEEQGEEEEVVKPVVVVEEEEDYVDLDAYEEEGLQAGDQATVKKAAAADETILKTRTYDLTIMYDKYYQTPRMFLVGFDESGRPLSPSAVFEDISQDYANKTATIEAHPHLGSVQQCVSIHPCRHANIMKKIFDNMTSDGSEARVDQALFIFLKFMQGLIPTIVYDFTLDVKLKPIDSGSVRR